MQFRGDDNNNNQDRGSGRDQGDNPEQSPQPQPPQDWRKWLWPGLLIFMLVWTLLSSGSLLGGSSQTTDIPYSTLVRQLEAGNVTALTTEGDTAVRGEFRNSVNVTLPSGRQVNVSEFRADVPPEGNARILEEALAAQALIEANPSQTSPLLLLLLNFGPFLLIIAFFIWTARRAQGQMNGVFGFGRSSAREYTAERPRVTFDDVAGQEAAKSELVEIVDFLKHPDKYISLGARVPKGVLLVGPPGTGKTLMARAVAGEANVAFFSLSASEFVEMFVGVGASRVRDLFNRAKNASPAIVFIDEIDAVGRQRGAGLGGGNDEREQTLNQLLAELDGFDQDTNIIVMAATNRPDVLDPALLRPGRFDRQVTVGLPDREGRESIIKIHTRGKPLSEDVNLVSLAKSTVGFSGADLSNLANEAALTAARRGRKTINMADFTSAFERIVLGTERPPLSNPEERRITAYHEAGHAIVAMLTPGADKVLKVTIVPRGQALGVTAFMPDDDRRNYPRSYLEARMRVALGGRVAEQIVFGDITTGAADDLRRVTEMARRMVSQFGMSESIGPLNFGDNDEQPFLGYSISRGRNYSEETASQIDQEVRRIVEHAYDETFQLLSDNRPGLQKLAEALMENEVVEATEVADILNVEPPEGSVDQDGRAFEVDSGVTVAEDRPKMQHDGDQEREDDQPARRDDDNATDPEDNEEERDASGR